MGKITSLELEKKAQASYTNIQAKWERIQIFEPTKIEADLRRFARTSKAEAKMLYDYATRISKQLELEFKSSAANPPLEANVQELPALLQSMRNSFLELYKYQQENNGPYISPYLESKWTRQIATFLVAFLIIVFGTITLAFGLPAVRDYQISKSYDDGKVAYENKEWNVAIKKFEYVYDREPDHTNTKKLLNDSYYQLTLIRLDEQKWTEARSLARKQLDLGIDQQTGMTNLVAAHNGLATVALNARDWQEVRNILDALQVETEIPLENGSRVIYQQSYYQEASAASQQADWNMVEILLTESLSKSNPDNELFTNIVTLLSESYIARAEILQQQVSNPTEWSQVRAAILPALDLPYARAGLDETASVVYEMYRNTWYEPMSLAFDNNNFPEVRSLFEEWQPQDSGAPTFKNANTLYIEAHYIPSVSAIDAEKWEVAYPLLQSLYEYDPNFSNAYNLYSMVIYKLGEKANSSGDVNAAQVYFDSLLQLNPTYAKAQPLLLGFYYDAAVTALENKEWSLARSRLAILDEWVPGYSNITTLRKDSYYLGISDALMQVTNSNYRSSPEVCRDQRDELGKFFDLYPEDGRNYKDAESLLHETYYCEVRIALNNGNLAEVLGLIEQLYDLSPYYKDIPALYNKTLYDLGSQALTLKDWDVAQGYFWDLWRREPAYQDIFTLLRESYYRPAEQLIDTGSFEDARYYLRSLIYGDATASTQFPPIDPNYKDTQELLRASFYEAALLAQQSGNYNEMRENLRALIDGPSASDPLQNNYLYQSKTPQIDPVYNETQTLYREAYYVPANQALEDEQWNTAQNLFGELLSEVARLADRKLGDPEYKDTQQLYFESYYADGKSSMDAENWENARNRLKFLIQEIARLTGVTVQESQYENTRELYKQAYYTPANDALERQDWQIARTLFYELLEEVSWLENVPIADATYEDAQVLLRESYFRPASHALENLDWETAKQEFSELIRLIESIEGVGADYNDARNLYIEAYLQPGFIALNERDWGLARTNALLVLENNPTHAEATSLLLRAHQLPAEEAIEASDWELARRHLGLIISPENFVQITSGPTLAVYRNVYNENKNLSTYIANYERTYSVPIEKLIEQNNFEEARQALANYKVFFDQFFTDPSERQAHQQKYHDYLLATYSEPFQQAIERNDWLTAAEQFVLIREQNLGDDSIYLVLAELPALQQALSQRFIPAWRLISLQDMTTIISAHNGIAINSIQFLPNDFRLVSVGSDGLIEIRHLQPSTDTTTDLRIQANSGWIRVLETDPKGVWLATSGKDETISIWDATTGQQITRLNGHTGLVNSLAVSPDGTILTSGGDDGILRLWTTSDWTIPPLVREFGLTITAVQISPDGAWLAVALSDGSVKLWNISSSENMATTEAGPYIVQIIFRPDSKTFMTVANDPLIREWTVDGELIQEIGGHSDWVRSATLSSDGQLLATISADNILLVQDTNGTILNSYIGLSNPSSIQFSPDGSILVVANGNGQLLAWHVN